MWKFMVLGGGTSLDPSEDAPLGMVMTSSAIDITASVKNAFARSLGLRIDRHTHAKNQTQHVGQDGRVSDGRTRRTP